MHAPDLEQTLKRLAEGTLSPADADLLRRLLTEGRIVIATGERAVAIGGSADGAVIITGDLHIQLDARRRADLERLLASHLHNVPLLPDHYIQREAFLAPLREALLRDGAPTLGIVGVQGMGGIGKSVLATALARDLTVQDAFPDGVIWLALGREPNLTARQEDLYLLLTGERENFKDPAQGRLFLAPALREKTCLVILDDLWELEHAEAFPLRLEGARARFLITTRNGELLQTLQAKPFLLEELTPDQALHLLAEWAGQEVSSLPPTACEVARKCGYLPLALAMVGAFVRQNPESWERALHRLQKADLEKLRRLFPGYQHSTLLAALEVSVAALPKDARARYLDLAVFPEEEAIPLDVLRAFWGLDADDVADLAETFVGRSLARWEETGRSLRLHDLQHDYLRAVQRDTLPDLHCRFLLACARSLLGVDGQTLDGMPWQRMPAEPRYLWDRLVYHLLEAGAWEALYRLLTDFDYLEARCRATSVFDLEADYRLALARWPANDADHRNVLAAFEERLRLEDYHIAGAPEWLFPALYNHLTWPDAPDGPLHALCEAARPARRNWLRALQDPRPQPPPWLRSLEGHTSVVTAVALSPDGGWIVSGSWDRTVKVWEAATGRLLRSLEGHTRDVTAVALSPDGGWIVSGSADGTVKVWEAATGRLLRSLEGHTGWVTAVAVSPDGGWIVSGSNDKTVKVWEAATGRLLRSLEGRTGWVTAVAVSPDGGWIVSGSWDRTVKVWEAATGRLLRSLEGHTEPVTAVAVSPDGGWIVSGSRDRTVKVWEAATGNLLRSLEGHTEPVTAVAVSPDGGWIVSGSWDRTVKVWEAATGNLLRSLEGHRWAVTAVALSPDGRFIVSGSADGTVKVWEWEAGRLLRSLEGHTRDVNAVALSADGGWVVSGSDDHTVKVWEQETGRLLRSLEGHTSVVNAVALSADGRLVVSGSDDHTVKVWEQETGRLLRSLEGHTGVVNAVALSADGRLVVSGSDDKTVKVWERETGRLLRSLEGHTGWVRAVALSADGRLVVSGSDDHTLRSWDLESGQSCLLFWNDAPILSLAFFGDNRTLACGDKQGRVWIFEWVR
jgi:WD40 repeat protein